MSRKPDTNVDPQEMIISMCFYSFLISKLVDDRMTKDERKDFFFKELLERQKN